MKLTAKKNIQIPRQINPDTRNVFRKIFVNFTQAKQKKKRI